MKKRFFIRYLGSYFSLVFCLTLISLLSINVSADELVCGNQPNSLIGYGQVELFPGVIYSCNNVPDNFCPEDYETAENSGIFGNCSRCHDPDCTGNISGSVLSYNGMPLSRALVTVLPIRYNLSAPTFEKSVLTDFSGKFFISGVTTGTYYVSAAHEGFDTQLIEVTVNRNKLTSGVNFNLPNGTCFEDCTNSYGRCNAKCNGLNFDNGICSFFNGSFSVYNIDASALCDNRLKGTEVLIQGTQNGTHALFLKCCEGTPYWKYYGAVSLYSSSIDNIIKIEKVAKYNEVPVKVIVAYWPPKK